MMEAGLAEGGIRGVDRPGRYEEVAGIWGLSAWGWRVRRRKESRMLPVSGGMQSCAL